jgi:hypothetical protein
MAVKLGLVGAAGSFCKCDGDQRTFGMLPIIFYRLIKCCWQHIRINYVIIVTITPAIPNLPDVT